MREGKDAGNRCNLTVCIESIQQEVAVAEGIVEPVGADRLHGSFQDFGDVRNAAEERAWIQLAIRVEKPAPISTILFGLISRMKAWYSTASL